MASETDEKIIRLTEGLSLKDLISKDGTTFEINFDDIKTEDDKYTYDSGNVYDYANPECLGLIDEDIYQDGEPFENLAKKMTDILEDGKIKKRIIREGYASTEKLPVNSTVTIDYNAYLEYNDEPFDSTSLRKRSFTFRLDDGQTLPGIDIAVQSMRLNEKSQFLVDPDYAFGKFGCPPRVPPNSTILYEIEVKNFVDSGASVTYPNLNEEEKKDFKYIYAYAHALSSKGKDLYSKGLIKQAIKEYNIAVGKLENCQLKDYAEQEKQQILLMRLRSNLLIAYTKIHEPRRACINYNQISNMCKGTDLKMSAKIYFNHARSLMQLAEYDFAERELRKAYNLEPQNKEIMKEFKKLDAKRKESHDREVTLAKAIFHGTEKKLTEISKDFENSITQYCKDLIEDEDTTQYELPEKLTQKELEFVKNEVSKQGLEFKSYKVDNLEKYFIAKLSNASQDK